MKFLTFLSEISSKVGNLFYCSYVECYGKHWDLFGESHAPTHGGELIEESEETQ